MSRQGTPDDGIALDGEAQLDPASPQDQGGEPTGEPIPPNTQPRLDDPALLQRAFTQSQQRWSDLRKGLGLGKDATPDDVLAAVAARSAAASEDDDGQAAPVPLSPAAVLEAEARAEAAEWRYYAAIYPDTAVAAREFAEFARSEKDPEALTLKFYEILNRFEAQTGGEAAGDEAGAAPGESGEARGQGVIDVGMGESPAADIQSDAAALERLRGSGRVAEGLRHIPGWNRMIGNP